MEGGRSIQSCGTEEDAKCDWGVVQRRSEEIDEIAFPFFSKNRQIILLTQLPQRREPQTDAPSYQKYAAIAAGTTALAGTLLGGTLPIIGALLVPSIPVAAAMGATTAAIRWSWAHRGNHFRQAWIVGIEEGRIKKKDAKIEAEEAVREEVRSRGNRRAEKGWKEMGSDGFQ